jgi:hypothetical protein
MHRIKKYCVFWLVIGGLYAACTAPAVPPAPPPPATPPPAIYEIPIPADSHITQQTQLALRNSACQDFLHGEDENAEDNALIEAYRRTPEDHPVLWTFGVNFDVFDEGDPLGCFRLYRRNEDLSRFDPIDGGGILVDTCRVMTQGSSGVRFAEGSAIFAGGYVQCDMDVGSWVEILTSTFTANRGDEEELRRFNEPITQTVTTGEGVLTINLTSTHVYSNFALVASVVKISRSASVAKEELIPLVSYQPEAPGRTDVDAPKLLIQKKNETVTFPETCQNVETVDVSSHELLASLATPAISIASPATWWHDLRPVPDGDGPVLIRQFAYGERTAPSLATLCVVAQGEDVKPLQFWIGPATLYIGYDPKTEATFTGTLDGVLVDPTNSKPGK